MGTGDENNQSRREVDQFITDHVDTVPHLEALLLLWRSRPQEWTADEAAKGLFISPKESRQLLSDLSRRALISLIPGETDKYFYSSEPEKDRVIELVDATYRKELIRITRMIHTRGSAAVRAFADAFRFTKDKE
jgi:DNA-binding IscR family transcriptional regulator